MSPDGTAGAGTAADGTAAGGAAAGGTAAAGGGAVPAGTVLLELRGLTMRFGGVVALSAVDLSVHAGEIFALIGPNGAGKTTVFNVVTGIYRPSGGAVLFTGRSLAGLPPYRVTKLGLARTFQNIRLFHNMSALENVLVGTDAHHRSGILAAGLGLPWFRREERQGRATALELLDFVGIGGRAEQTAKNLPYGDQRRLEIARALATDPKVLLLDEPAAGMNPSEKESLQILIRNIRDSGRTVVLIEHDMSLVMGISDRIAVLDFGQKIADAAPAAVQNDPKVIAAYLGEPADAS